MTELIIDIFLWSVQSVLFYTNDITALIKIMFVNQTVYQHLYLISYFLVSSLVTLQI